MNELCKRLKTWSALQLWVFTVTCVRVRALSVHVRVFVYVRACVRVRAVVLAVHLSIHRITNRGDDLSRFASVFPQCNHEVNIEDGGMPSSVPRTNLRTDECTNASARMKTGEHAHTARTFPFTHERLHWDPHTCIKRSKEQRIDVQSFLAGPPPSQ